MRYVPLFQQLTLVIWCFSLVVVGAASYWVPRAVRRAAPRATVLHTLALSVAGVAVLLGLTALAISLLLMDRRSSYGTVVAVTWLVAATLVPGTLVTATVSLILRNAERRAQRCDAAGRTPRAIVDGLATVLRRPSGDVRAS